MPIIAEFTEDVRRPITSGVYRATILNVLPKVTKLGKPALECEFLVSAGESKGSTMFRTFVLTPEGRRYFEELHTACGFPALQTGRQTIDEADYIGKDVVIDVVARTHEGRQVYDIGRITAI